MRFTLKNSCYWIAHAIHTHTLVDLSPPHYKSTFEMGLRSVYLMVRSF